MAVYTQVSAEALAEFLSRYDHGALRSAKGIAEGVQNSNYLVDTDRDRFILTLYEERTETDELPFSSRCSIIWRRTPIPCRALYPTVRERRSRRWPDAPPVSSNSSTVSRYRTRRRDRRMRPVRRWATCT